VVLDPDRINVQNNPSRNLLATLYPDPFEEIPERYSLFMESISGIPFSVTHLFPPLPTSNCSSGSSRVDDLVPQPPVPSASVPHMTWRFLAGMPWTSVWQYPSKRTLVSTIYLQLGQYLCPPFRVSMVESSYLFVLLVGGGQRVF